MLNVPLTSVLKMGNQSFTTLLHFRVQVLDHSASMVLLGACWQARKRQKMETPNLIGGYCHYVLCARFRQMVRPLGGLKVPLKTCPFSVFSLAVVFLLYISHSTKQRLFVLLQIFLLLFLVNVIFIDLAKYKVLNFDVLSLVLMCFPYFVIMVCSRGFHFKLCFFSFLSFGLAGILHRLLGM